MPMPADIYFEFTLLLGLACAMGLLGMLLRQPLIVAFIVTGIVAGPSVLGLVEHHQSIDLLAQVGVTILLFIVGLKLDLHLVRHLGPVALATGLGQLGFTIVFGFMIGLLLGLDVTASAYIAVALTFSSTIIIVKLLSDKREIDSLHGRIAMGFLIVQDIAVVIAMMALGSSSAATDMPAATLLLTIVLKLAAAVVLILLAMKYLLPRLMQLIARSQELLLVFALAWGTLLAAGGELLGFSKEVGAFLAGFSMASTAFREAITARLSSLRDFLLLFFFIDLGAKFELGSLGDALLPAIIFSLFVLIGNPLIVMVIMGYMGYRKRTAFMAGLTVAQISEFSIIFVAMGISLGHVSEQVLSLVTLVGLVTIALSTYMILYSGQLYLLLEPWLGMFERRRPYREQRHENELAKNLAADLIVFGMGRYGKRLARDLAAHDIRVLSVDFDPEIIKHCQQQNLTVFFGDATDPALLESLPLSQVSHVISTLSDNSQHLMLYDNLKQHGYNGRFMATAHQPDNLLQLHHAGIDHVFVPLHDAADHAAHVIKQMLGNKS